MAACAGHRHDSGDVIVNTRGVDMHSYHHDLAECRAYADQVGVGRRTAGGALAGAVVGGAVGAIAGNSDTAERGPLGSAAPRAPAPAFGNGMGW